MTDVFISLNRCRHGVEMLSLDNGGIATNLTGDKCCGQWQTVKRWHMKGHDLGVAAFAFTEAMDGPKP